MQKEIRTIVYDRDLGIEAYRFRGIVQEFPNHFHDYYVIGFMERGERTMRCNGIDYGIGRGDLILLNPGDRHTCEQIDGKSMDYRSLNIKTDAVRRAAQEIFGVGDLPRFPHPVASNRELFLAARNVHAMIMKEADGFRKEEAFLLFLKELFDRPATSVHNQRNEPRPEIKAVCRYLEEHYAESVRLDELSLIAGLSKYHLLRAFTREMGISPYSYLETIRIREAKKMLEAGLSPAEAAEAAGFSDQSHFTNFFKRFIGLTPRQYRDIFAEKTEKTAQEEKERA